MQVHSRLCQFQVPQFPPCWRVRVHRDRDTTTSAKASPHNSKHSMCRSPSQQWTALEPVCLGGEHPALLCQKSQERGLEAFGDLKMKGGREGWRQKLGSWTSLSLWHFLAPWSEPERGESFSKTTLVTFDPSVIVSDGSASPSRSLVNSSPSLSGVLSRCEIFPSEA